MQEPIARNVLTVISKHTIFFMCGYVEELKSWGTRKYT